jgi:hypothetical protein
MFENAAFSSSYIKTLQKLTKLTTCVFALDIVGGGGGGGFLCCRNSYSIYIFKWNNLIILYVDRSIIL